MIRYVEAIADDEEGRAELRRLRTWVMSDSDALAACEHDDAQQHCQLPQDQRPACAPSQDVCLLARACDEAGLTHHVLQRRMIENYVTPHALNSYCEDTRRFRKPQRDELRPRYRVFRDSFSPEQQHFFDMKRGFDRERNQSQRATLYRDIGAEEAALFAKQAFGRDLAEHVFGPDYQEHHRRRFQEDLDEEARREIDAIMRSIFSEV